MNELSWFLYLADVVAALKVMATVVAVISAMCIFGWLLFNWIQVMHEDEIVSPKLAHYSIPVVIGLIAILTPSQTTIYAIAASEMGEELLKSSTTTKAQKALDAWLDRQIEGEKK